MQKTGGRVLNNKAIDNEYKKDYLKGYERAVRQMERSELRIRELRLSKSCPSVVTDGMPHASNNSDLSGYAALLDQEERKYMKARYQRIRKCKEITDKIERLKDDDEKDVLIYRYIKLMKWEDICVKMQLSWRRIHYIHSAALEKFKID